MFDFALSMIPSSQGGQRIPKSVIQAARWVTDVVRPIDQKHQESLRLAEAIHGKLNEIPYKQAEVYRSQLRSEGSLGWDPRSTILQATWTPDVEDFAPKEGQGKEVKYLCRTVMFCERFARPLADVSMRCLSEPSKPHDWELLSILIYLIDEEGEDYSRPFLVTPRAIVLT